MLCFTWNFLHALRNTMAHSRWSWRLLSIFFGHCLHEVFHFWQCIAYHTYDLFMVLCLLLYFIKKFNTKYFLSNSSSNSNNYQAAKTWKLCALFNTFLSLYPYAQSVPLSITQSCSTGSWIHLSSTLFSPSPLKTITSHLSYLHYVLILSLHLLFIALQTTLPFITKMIFQMYK